jgi:hypothetical protein
VYGSVFPIYRGTRVCVNVFPFIGVPQYTGMHPDLLGCPNREMCSHIPGYPNMYVYVYIYIYIYIYIHMLGYPSIWECVPIYRGTPVYGNVFPVYRDSHVHGLPSCLHTRERHRSNESGCLDKAQAMPNLKPKRPQFMPRRHRARGAPTLRCERHAPLLSKPIIWFEWSHLYFSLYIYIDMRIYIYIYM